MDDECSLCLPGSEWVDKPVYECVECPRGKFKVLFGDLIAAVEESVDGVDADNMSRDLRPGTNAQRHRLHHAKHGHASGGLGLLKRRHSSHGLKRSGSILQRSGSTNSRSDEENVQAPVSRRPQLNRSATWRTSAPSVEM